VPNFGNGFEMNNLEKSQIIKTRGLIEIVEESNESRVSPSKQADDSELISLSNSIMIQ